MRYWALLPGLTGCSDYEVSGTTAPVPLTSSLHVEPPALMFGSLAPEETATRRVTLTASGDAGVTIQAVTLDDAAFTLLSAPVGVTLGPGESAEVEVALSPLNFTESATVWVESTAGEPVPVPLSGSALIGALGIQPSPLYVGHVDPGASETGALTVSNIGLAAVTIDQLALVDAAFSIASAPALPLTLEPGGRDELTVSFSPSEEGAFTGLLWMSSDEPVGERAAALQGSSGDAYAEAFDDPDAPEDDGCLDPDSGYESHPEARLIINDWSQPITATYTGSDAGYTSELWLYSPAQQHIATGHDTPEGTTVEIGAAAAGTELVFQLVVLSTGDVFYSGPPARNEDGHIHAALTYIGDCQWRVGFEDQWGGGDQDFDDIQMVLSGDLAISL